MINIKLLTTQYSKDEHGELYVRAFDFDAARADAGEGK